MIITFAGHSNILSKGEVKEKVKEQIRSNMVENSKLICYLGGYGDFDTLCAQACRELKLEDSMIEVLYVMAYISLSEQIKFEEMKTFGLFDSSVYPPIENVPKRFAISKRNEWMITNSDLLIAYIDHSYGGAYKSFLLAKKKGKKIINICDFI